MSSIQPQTAVKNAKQILLTLDPDDPPRDLKLEEISHTTLDSREAWAVTLGFYRPRSVEAITPKGSGLLGLGFPAHSKISENRVYKTVYIDDESGEFIRMDIREL